MSRLSHLDESGKAKMVDVGGKTATHRRAVVEGRVVLKPSHVDALGDSPKGDVLGVARVAGIMAGKRCSELVPLCHQVPLSLLDVSFELVGEAIHIRATAEAAWTTGVEMEAYTAVAMAGVTIIDMLKGVDPDLELSGVRLIEKTGGKTLFRRS